MEKLIIGIVKFFMVAITLLIVAFVALCVWYDYGTGSRRLIYNHKPEIYYANICDKYIKISQANDVIYVGVSDSIEQLDSYNIVCPENIDYLKFVKDDATCNHRVFINNEHPDTLYVMCPFNSVSFPMINILDTAGLRLYPELCSSSDSIQTFINPSIFSSFYINWPRNDGRRTGMICDKGFEIQRIR